MTDAAKQLVLISHQMLSPVQQALEAAGYEVARRWELAPGQAEQVRAIMHAGEIPLSHDFLESLPQLGLIANVSVGYDFVVECRVLYEFYSVFFAIQLIFIRHCKFLRCDEMERRVEMPHGHNQ